jgi:phage terminase large subunit-like protein
VTIDVPATWSSLRSRWESPDGRYFFDAVTADRGCAFFPELLTHHIGEFVGLPFALMEYQAKLLTRPLWGWKRSSDGLRRFRKVFGFLPKGNGKSPWGAGTGLYAARCDGEAAAEVYAVAADTSQARIVYENAKIMVEQSEDLAEGCEILRDSLYWQDTHSVYKVLSSDAKTKHGFRPHVVIFDELHAQRDRALYEALKRSMVKRRQPIMIILTHAGVDDEGICHEEYEYAKNVLSATIEDDSCLPVIFEFAPDADWTDPAEWAKVTPGLGITVKLDGLAQECREAINEPRKRNDFLMFHGNRWVNQAVAWIPVDWWDACAAPLPPDAELAQHPGAVGIDMAQKIDLAAAVAVFRLPLAAGESARDVEVVIETDAGERDTKSITLDYRIAIVPAFWLPSDTLRERVKQDRVPYDQWRDDGLLHVVDGAMVTSEPIVRYLVGGRGRDGIIDRFPLLKQAPFGFDPAFATEVAARLRDDHDLQVIEVPQNYTHLSEACYVFEALIKAGRVLHGGHRLLRWNLENVAVKRDDAGRIRPVKPRKAAKRIDGIVAVLIALSRLIAMEGDPDTEASDDYSLGLPGFRDARDDGGEA